MKAGIEHTVPLDARALAVLERARPLAKANKDGAPQGLVFPGARQGRPLSNMAMLELVRGMLLQKRRALMADWGRFIDQSEEVELG